MECINYKKLQEYLLILATRTSLLGFNPNNFKTTTILGSGTNPTETEEVYSSNSSLLYLYEKYKWVSEGYREGHWERTQIYLSKNEYAEYEKPFEEKLVSTVYEAITEEQYQALIEYNKKTKRSHR